MINIGTLNTLIAYKQTKQGLYLACPDGDEVLLPRKYTPEDLSVGDELEVFVYTDSKDLPVATTQTPLAMVGDFAFLRCVDVTPHGAFMDWGLDKDLFVPHRLQHEPLVKGRRYVVALALHQSTQRVIAATRLAEFFDYEVSGLLHGQQVDLLVFGFSPDGAQVVIDNRHRGLLYNDQATRRVARGERLTGFVQKVRDDNKVDVILGRPGREGQRDAASLILEALESQGGFLPLHDKSDPQEIRAQLGLSKKAFKKAVGSLYRARQISLTPEGIRTKTSSKPEKA